MKHLTRTCRTIGLNFKRQYPSGIKVFLTSSGRVNYISVYPCNPGYMVSLGPGCEIFRSHMNCTYGLNTRAWPIDDTLSTLLDFMKRNISK